MEKPFNQDASIKKLRAVSRRAISVAPDALVTESLLDGRQLPLVMQPALHGLDVVAWSRNNRELIEEKLFKHGGILFRGFEVGTAARLEQIIRAIAGEPLQYSERSSPRSQVSGNIYTSTDYPAGYSIFLHNENSYQHTWPLKIFFCCKTPAREGGETPIADCRGVLARISGETKQRFIEKKWMYVRNFGQGFGLSWQTAFNSNDRVAVEQHCRANRIRAEWREGDRLRVSAVREAIASHPLTGEQTWFNHAAFFHVSTLEPSIREGLLSHLDQEELPTNSFYGDGTAIEQSVLDELREAYRRETVSFTWQRGDLLMLDNMLVAHGRAPYSGPREILVGMCQPFSGEQG